MTNFLGETLQEHALREWPFLTAAELALVASEHQLATLIAERSGRTAVETAPLIHDWMERQGMSRTAI